MKKQLTIVAIMFLISFSSLSGCLENNDNDDSNNENGSEDSNGLNIEEINKTQNDFDFIIEDLDNLTFYLENITEDNDETIVWYDDFESESLQWDTKLIGTEASIIPYHSQHYYSKNHSTKIITGSNFEDYSSIIKPFLGQKYGVFSIEISFTISDNEDCKIFRLYQRYEGENDINNGTVKIDISNNKLFFYDENGRFQEFATDVSLFAYEHCWHHMKLIVDFNSSEYINFTLDSITYNLTGNKLNKHCSVEGYNVIFVEFMSFSNGVNKAESYVDEFIMSDLSS